MTAKRFTIQDERVLKDNQKYVTETGYVLNYKSDAEEVCNLLNKLHEEKEYLKTRFHEERELAMKLSRECDALTIKKQELELEIIRLEAIIKTGDDGDYNRTS